MSEFLSPRQSRQNQFAPPYFRNVEVNPENALTQE